jgi:Tfp pilus assembly protein PilF
VPPTWDQVLFAVGLAGIWVVLIAFGVVSAMNPSWLQELSGAGQRYEAEDLKCFGDEKLRRGEYQWAITQYRASLRVLPDQLPVMANMAVAWAQAGDKRRAMSILRQAEAMASNQYGEDIVHYNIGLLLEEQGEAAQAMAQYEKAVGYGVHRDLVYRRLGALHLAAEEFPAAREAFEQTLEAQTDPCLPYLYMLHRSRSTAVEGDEHHEAISAALDRGVTVDELARYDLRTIEALRERDPEVAKTHNHLGLIFARIGDYNASARHFRRSLEIWPGNEDATRNLRILEGLDAQP